MLDSGGWWPPSTCTHEGQPIQWTHVQCMVSPREVCAFCCRLYLYCYEQVLCLVGGRCLNHCICRRLYGAGSWPSYAANTRMRP